ncbi:MAG: hypothetical protein U1F52_03205 [Burkholderiales bacterium]
MQRRESDLLDRVDARFRHVERGARASFDDPSCVAIGRAAPTLRSGRQGGLKAIGLAAVLMVVGTASAQERWVGYLEVQGRRESREGEGRLRADLATLRVDGSTPVWEPWFADLTAGVGLTARTTRQTSESQDGVDVTGGARLRLFPRSTFPLELFVDRADTRISGELVGPEFTQTVYGLTQAYAPSAGTRYSFNYRHTDREDRRSDIVPPATQTTDDFFSVSVNRAFERHQFDARVDYDRLARDEPTRLDTRQVGLIRHRYGATTHLTVDTFLSSVDSRTDDRIDQSRSSLQQWNSNVFWRPNTARPLLVTGSFVFSDLTTETVAAGAGNQTAVGTVGLSYQSTPTLALRANANVTRFASEGRETLATLMRGGVTYSPLDLPVRGLYYRRSLSADLGYRTDERTGLATEEVSANLSHGLVRLWPWAGGSANASATQLVTTLRNGADLADTRLTHSASVDWSAAGLASSGSVRVLLADTHRFETDSSSFQMFNLQLSGRHQITRLAGWQGSLTLQSTRTSSAGAASPWVSNTSATVTYRHERLFGVPLLRFTSEFRALSDELAQSTRDGFSLDHRARWVWSNRLDYIVGRLQFTVRGSVGEVEGRRQGLMFLQVRRYFSQMP